MSDQDEEARRHKRHIQNVVIPSFSSSMHVTQI